MRTKTIIALGVGLASLVPLQSHADQPLLVVTATRTPTPISEIGSSVSVLTGEDLRNLGVSHVDDALRTLPGVSVTQNGGPGGFSAVRIRGEESYRTLTLLDGIRIDDPVATQIATNFANLLVFDVARIEVVRGPQSLLYGADAVGGVIQILTQRPESGFHYTAEASGGAYHTFAGAGTLSYGSEKFGAVISASHHQTRSFTAKVGDPDLADPDAQKVLALHGIVSAEPSDAFSLEAVGHFTKSYDSFDGASAFPPFSPADPNRLLKTEQVDGRFAVKHHGWNGVRTELAYAVSSIRRADLDNGLPFVSFGTPLSNFNGDRQEASLVSTVSLSPDETLVIGADRTWISAKTDTSDESGADTGVYGELESTLFDELHLTGGVRYDEDDDFGSHVSGRVTVAWLPKLLAGGTTKFHASYGTGFRAPSPFERATNKSAGLADLKEEQSRGFDAGLTQGLFSDAVMIDTTYFEQVIENEIRFDNVGFTGYFQQPGESHSRGIELTSRYHQPLKLGPLSSIGLDSSFTYDFTTVHSPDAENGLPRIRRPRYVTASTLSFGFGADRALLGFTVRTAAKSEDGFSSFRVPLDGYAVLDVSARWKIARNVELFARGANVFNEQYQEVSGFATSDAAIYAGIRLRG